MYLFSVDATPKADKDDLKAGKVYPFIVYINYKDLFGAEHLCKLYLMRAGFTDIKVMKRKALEKNWAENKKVLQADKALQECLDYGYSVQLFEGH